MEQKQAIETLDDIREQYAGDAEAAQSHAVEFLCEFIESLGYPDVVKAYERIETF